MVPRTRPATSRPRRSPLARAQAAPRLPVRTTAAIALAVAVAASPLVAAAWPTTVAAATVAQLVGQKLVVAMDGTTPSASLLGRVERGEVGGVILFGSNVTTVAGVASITRSLQAAAAGGGQPPLLIATDQEGGSIRRIPWAPPSFTVPDMGAAGSATTASDQGSATGRALGCAGINVNFAPVADVPSSTSSFMYRQGRTWSFDAAVTTRLADAFATGHAAGGSAPAMKHFPGIGRATQNTDSSVVTITSSAATLDAGLDPYRAAIAHGIPLVMLSNATYTAWDASNGAGWSRAISVGLLRTTLGFTGVSITDSLTGTAAARGVSASSLAIKAAAAGTDMILVTGSEASTAATYTALVKAATAGSIPLTRLQASYDRILALKAALPAVPADTEPPSLAAPMSTLPAGKTLGAGTVPVRTAWAATDPCRIAKYGLERQVDGGSWSRRSLAGYWTRSVVETLQAGATVRYRARATDNGGRTTAWIGGAAFRPFVRQETGGVVAFEGSWGSASSTSYSGGTAAWSTSPGASATYRFTGSSIAWVTGFGPTRGSAEIWVDGARAAVVSTHASTVSLRRLAWARSWSQQGTHTIRIVVVGTPGSPRVDVDAFVRLWRP